MPVSSPEAVVAAVRALVVDSVNVNMPVEAYLHEAIALAGWAEEDRDAIARLGIDVALIDEIPLRVDTAREAESEWYATRFSRESAQSQWDVRGPAAYEHRDALVRTLRFAYRKDDLLLGRVAGIAEGTGHNDMVQDLSDIVALARNNPEPLQKMSFNLDDLNQTAALAKELGAILGTITNDRMEQSQAKLYRDQALFYLKQAVDEIRAAGQYINAKNPDRLKGYHSIATKRRNATSRNIIKDNRAVASAA